MLELRCVYDGVIWAEKGKEDDDGGGDTEGGGQGGQNRCGLNLQAGTRTNVSVAQLLPSMEHTWSGSTYLALEWVLEETE